MDHIFSKFAARCGVFGAGSNGRILAVFPAVGVNRVLPDLLGPVDKVRDFKLLWQFGDIAVQPLPYVLLSEFRGKRGWGDRGVLRFRRDSLGFLVMFFATINRSPRNPFFF